MELTVFFIGLGLITGLPVALAQLYGNALVKITAVLFEQISRGLPALVILLLFYFGLSPLGVPVLLSATLAMGFRTAGYQSQIFRQALQSVDPGQELAARAIGMTRSQTIRCVILPQALRLAIPAWSNESVNTIKDTSYVFVVGIVELMRQARYVVARTFGNSLLVYSFVALVYFALVYSSNLLLGVLMRRLQVPGLGTGGREMRL